MKSKMKELGTISKLDLSVNNKPRLYTEPIDKVYGEKYNFMSLSRWLARWYKCFCYKPKQIPK